MMFVRYYIVLLADWRLWFHHCCCAAAGRQMFEQDVSLALSDAQFLTDDMESGQTEVEVDEALFQDMDDLELTDT